MKTLNNQEQYLRAKEKVKELQEFYINLGIYLLAVPFFIVLNIYSTSFPWAIFPIAGWGLGVFFHAMGVYGWFPFLGKNWEERKIKELMNNNQF